MQRRPDDPLLGRTIGAHILCNLPQKQLFPAAGCRRRRRGRALRSMLRNFQTVMEKL